MGRRVWASLGVLLAVASCTLPVSEDSDEGQDGSADDSVDAASTSAVVVEDALLVAGERSIFVHPASGSPFEIMIGAPASAMFEDGAGGLLYATGQPGDRRSVLHIPAGSVEAFTLVDDLTEVYDLGIVGGRPAVLGGRQAGPGAPMTLVAVHLTGEEQPLLELPPTAASVDQGGGRLVLGHLDPSTTPPCTWFEVRDMSGEVLAAPPGLSAEQSCVEEVEAVPVTSLSPDGRRFAVASPSDAGTSVRVVDLDLGGEEVVIVPDVLSLDLGLTGGLVVSRSGLVELAAGGAQTWLRPFPPDTDASDAIQVVHSPLHLASDLVDGESVAVSDGGEPPGVVLLAGEVLIGPGSVGETVLSWQRQLNRWLSVSALEDREPLPVTGVYDPATQGLTEAFVAGASLEDDGTIDERDLEELTRQIAILENGPGVIRNGDSGDIVLRWQTQLARWIDLAEPEDIRRSVRADGVFGDGTEDAMRVFEESVGNSADGVVQPADRAAMEQVLIELDAATTAGAVEGEPDDG